LLLNATNRFTGAVNVFSGTLVINGVLTNSQLNVVNATLGGTGIVSGPVIIQSGGTVAPGGTNAISTLTVRGAVNLLGTTAIEIRKTGTNAASDSLKGISTLTYGGTLEVNLLAGELGANDAFELFQANEYAGNFTLLNLPQLPFGLYWDVSGLNTSGTIRVGEITRPVLAPLMRQPDGTVLLTFSGLAGLTYQVWATGDFRWGWTVVGNGTFAPDGSGSFYDWLAQFYPDQRFYLISVP
jgi:hypothetical protein